jgi:alpha-methylacyl-CoA racemase
MVDGSALLMAQMYAMRAQGMWSDTRGANLLDTGAPFYDVYATSDGGYVSVGPIEPAFFAELLAIVGIDDLDPRQQYDAQSWPALRARLAEAFAGRSRDSWIEAFAGSDACVAPVLSMAEAPEHPHNVARSTFLVRDGVVQPAPAPRFSRTSAEVRLSPPSAGEHTDAVLAGLGIAPEEVAALRERGVVQ